MPASLGRLQPPGNLLHSSVISDYTPIHAILRAGQYSDNIFLFGDNEKTLLEKFFRVALPDVILRDGGTDLQDFR